MMLTALQDLSTRPHCLAMAGSILKYCKMSHTVHVLRRAADCTRHLIKRTSQGRIQWNFRLRRSFESHRVRVDVVCDWKDKKPFGKVM